MQIQYGSQSSQGRVRPSNEDSCIVDPETGLFLVADGMGGHAAGEIASRLAARTVEERVASREGAGEGPAEMLRLAAVEANARVYDAQRQDRDLAGMGSTLTALLFQCEKYYIAHVGDSRAYRLRSGVLEQLTRDHSLVWHLYENGVLRKADLSSHPQKNLITRSIGSHPQVEVDLEEGEGSAGDIYVLCSDGLTDCVTDEGIRDLLAVPGATPAELAGRLVEAANQAGGPDNITVVVVGLEADAASGSPPAQ